MQHRQTGRLYTALQHDLTGGARKPQPNTKDDNTLRPVPLHKITLEERDWEEAQLASRPKRPHPRTIDKFLGGLTGKMIRDITPNPLLQLNKRPKSLWALAYKAMTGEEVREVYCGPKGSAILREMNEGELRYIVKLQRGDECLPAYGGGSRRSFPGDWVPLSETNGRCMVRLAYGRRDLTDDDCDHIIHFFPRVKTLVSGMLKMGYPWLQGNGGLRRHRRKISKKADNPAGREAAIMGVGAMRELMKMVHDMELEMTQVREDEF